LNNVEMSDDDELPPYIENGKPGHFEMDAKFCARLHAAIAKGLESAPIGVVTTPCTKNPKYVANQTGKYHRTRDER
jgi:hypothetical protein